MSNNQLIIAAAGSGKTTFLIKEAIKIEDKQVLITTYTEANETEIRRKIVKYIGYIPNNITIQTWFSFLLQHGVRPYQSSMNEELHNKKIGFFLTEKQSGHKYTTQKGFPVYWGKDDFFKYYFSESLKIYSDKISKFIFDCNKVTDGEVVDRISRIYPIIFIDEVQDLAGWDLEILNLLFNSESNVLMVGDPRQVTYLTHHPKKHRGFKNGKIANYIRIKCKEGICHIDSGSLNASHRNNEDICAFSSGLFPEYEPSVPCTCKSCRNYSVSHEGIYMIRTSDITEYCKKYSPTVLKFSKATYPEWNYGKSKGLSFKRVLIYPTDKIKKYLEDGDVSKIDTIRAKFYVALTRARYSAGIVCDYDDNTDYIEGLKKHRSM